MPLRKLLANVEVRIAFDGCVGPMLACGLQRVARLGKRQNHAILSRQTVRLWTKLLLTLFRGYHQRKRMGSKQGKEADKEWLTDLVRQKLSQPRSWSW
jgi:hypothetical protein